MANVLFTDGLIHLWGFGFVFPIKELWEGSTLDGVNAVGKETQQNDTRGLTCNSLFSFM